MSLVIMREIRLRRAFTGDAHFEQVGLNFSKLP
jgi:hypothetical protein